MAVHDIPELPEWATGAGATIEEPDQAIKDDGYNSTQKPVREFDNWLTKYTYLALKWVLESGVTGYNDEHTFKKGSVCIGRDWNLYQSQQEGNTGHDPEADDGTWWKPPGFPDATESNNAITKGQLEGSYSTAAASDLIYMKKSQNLDDLASKAASRTNLNVYSKSETYSRSEINANLNMAPIGSKQFTDGTILQFGTTGSANDVVNNFDIPFPNACYTIVGTPTTGADSMAGCYIYDVTTTGFKKITAGDEGNPGDFPVRYIAIGY
jgi:hypothetical protein